MAHNQDRFQTISLEAVIEKTARHALAQQGSDGSFPSGHNGVYKHAETPVRNTAHFLCILSFLYRRRGERIWREAGECAIDYLVGASARPHGYTFYCRHNHGDRCNGLVGQAWVIEGMLAAADAFDSLPCYQLANDLFFLHPWCEEVGLWKRVDIDGRVIGFDGTFNHQLWFAAVGGLLNNSKEAQRRAELFLDRIASSVRLYKNGVLFHCSPMGRVWSYRRTGAVGLLREVKGRMWRKAQWNSDYLRSVGYQGFNLHGFTILKNIFPEHRIWSSNNFSRCLVAHQREEFQESLRRSIYGYKYNVSGIEIAYAEETFFGDDNEVERWLNLQFKETYLSESSPLGKGVIDPNTSVARVYEATRFKKNYSVKVPSRKVT